jgi:hypothetical protein
MSKLDTDKDTLDTNTINGLSICFHYYLWLFVNHLILLTTLQASEWSRYVVSNAPRAIFPCAFLP